VVEIAHASAELWVMQNGTKHSSDEAGSSEGTLSSRQAVEIPQTLTVYRPDSRTSDGILAALRHLFAELWTFRSHVATVYQRDLRQTYRGTPLAVFWQFALPLVPAAVYTGLATSRVLPSAASIPVALYVAIGVTLWFLFVGCIQNPINVVRSRNSEAMKTALPLSVAIAAGFARLLVETGIRLALCVLLMVWHGVMPTTGTLIAVPVLMVALIGFMGCGLLLSILNISFPDIDRVTSVFLPYGIFLSSVMFPLADAGHLSFLQWVNPFAVFIDSVRQLICEGVLPHPQSLGVFSVVAVVLGVIGCRHFYIMEYRIRGVS